MTATPTPGAIKKFRRTPWRFQQTVERPDAGELERFVSTIITAHGGLEAATVTIDSVILDTVRMSALCPDGAALTHDVSLVAQSPAEAKALLCAAFWDGPDFICIPTPKPFVFYADHDDWITFYANTKSHLNHVIEPLASHGYKLVKKWEREL
ncbi:MAG: hypothetical protein KJ072_05325 [Verrucomicrobia bacterium]|nr:hypothetical protein [Verrucomicrobiota bacterium]